MEKNRTKLLVGDRVAEIIKEERERQGLSLYRLAEKSGIPASNLHRIEKGLVCPRIDTVHAICVALDLEIQLPIQI